MNAHIRHEVLGRLLAVPLAMLTACYSGLELSPDASGSSGDAADAGPDEAEGSEGSAGPDRSPDDPGGDSGHDEVQSSLAQLTNMEFVTSVRLLLGLELDEALAEATAATLSAQVNNRGLYSDVQTQRITHLGLSRYIAVTEQLVDEMVTGIVEGSSGAEAALGDLQQHLGCDLAGPQGEPLLGAAGRDCLAAYGEQRLSTAFRRPAEPGDVVRVQELMEVVDTALAQAEVDVDSVDAYRMQLKAIIASIALSPEFLLLVEQPGTDEDAIAPRPLSSPEIATRLALLLGGSLPIGALHIEGSDADLDTVEGRLERADSLLNDDLVQQHVARLTTQWLGIDSLVDPAARAQMREFVGEWVRQSYPAGELYTRSVEVTHVDGETSSQPVGVLGLPAFLEAHSSAPTPAFIHRGEFVVERLLCSNLPDDVPEAALDAGEQTPLEVFENHSQDPCATCHIVMDDYGAAFQQYDAETFMYDPAPNELGEQFELFEIGDVSGTVSGLPDLAALLGKSDRARECMAQLWLRAAMRRDLDKEGRDEDLVEEIVHAWQDSGDASVGSLLRVVLATDEFATFYP